MTNKYQAQEEYIKIQRRHETREQSTNPASRPSKLSGS